MTQKLATAQRWSTSSFGSPADTSPIELAALGDHLNRCDGQRGAWFALKCSVDALNRFLAPRVVTTLLAFTALCVIAGMLL